MVNGRTILVESGPILVIDGVSLGLQIYNQGNFGADYVSSDGLYVWSVRHRSVGLYDGSARFLKSCWEQNDDIADPGHGGEGGSGGPGVEPYDPENPPAMDGANPGGGFFP